MTGPTAEGERVDAAAREATGDALRAHADALAERVTDAYFLERPEDLEKWGERGRAFCIEDSRYHVEYLAAAVTFASARTFTDYLQWLHALLVPRGLGAEHIRVNLQHLKAAVEAASLPALDARVVTPVLDEGLRVLDELEQAE